MLTVPAGPGKYASGDLFGAVQGGNDQMTFGVENADGAWVPGTMLGARVGRPNLLFWIEPWPHRASVVPL